MAIRNLSSAVLALLRKNARISVQELADRITFAGIEIEGIEEVGVDFTGICAALVKTCEPHPNSDHLHVCTVFDGKEDLQIVCGAPNCRAGLVTPLAHIGAKVPEGGETLKKGKLRGVESFGMLCSARELKLSDDHSGILELDPATKPGTPLAELYADRKPETVFDVEIMELLEGRTPSLTGYTLTRKGGGQLTAVEPGIEIRNMAGLFKDRIADPYFVTYEYSEAQQNAPIEQVTHPGQEFDYVLDGEMKIVLGGNEVYLKSGDSIYYDSSLPHAMYACERDTRFIAVVIK